MVDMSADQNEARTIADKGERIYTKNIKADIDLEKESGKFVIIDVDSGDYEIDKRDAVASRRLHERRPNGVFYGIRIGFPAAYRMGGRFFLRKDDQRQG